MRTDGKVIATFQQFAGLEGVLGPYGGQVTSFDWVFSPKEHGAPEPLFDRQTGEVPAVVAVLARSLRSGAHRRVHLDAARPALKGRIHLFVGTADTFYLDGAAHKFEAVLKRWARSRTSPICRDDRTSISTSSGRIAMRAFDQISAEMYAIARPEAHWKAPMESK